MDCSSLDRYKETHTAVPITYTTMANFFAALLAAAAVFQVGTAAPTTYPGYPTNITTHVNVARNYTTVLPPVKVQVQRREIRTFPINLQRP
ncbi:hypothetical protein F5Y17DRAFT_8807 [Xylariaceae sp. FL0594]|nr:hypothetical protein F5Y17DRAFT_8807 [Xylariaceae sp. FL0594]